MRLRACVHLGRRRRLIHIPTPVVAQVLRIAERLMGPDAFATWDEAELMEVSMLPADGSADVAALVTRQRAMSAVLALS